ncbi:MAG: ABC transporter ATP-binding protein, partial [bacterium]
TTVGLVGPSGAGKSTLVKLLIRFYDPQEGRIVVGGYDVRDYDINSLRSGFGIVLQEPFLFSGTIRENIALGDPGAGDGSIREAARIANASAFIEALPEGYDTQIGEKGARLSGGQNQRIAIARVALSNPRILILDEATSALDARADQHVSEALQRLMRGRTSMIIAHRLSTVVNADELLLLDEGRLVAKGRHDDLITRSRLYERLYTLQFAEEAEKSAVGGELGAGV